MAHVEQEYAVRNELDDQGFTLKFYKAVDNPATRLDFDDDIRGLHIGHMLELPDSADLAFNTYFVYDPRRVDVIVEEVDRQDAGAVFNMELEFAAAQFAIMPCTQNFVIGYRQKRPY